MSLTIKESDVHNFQQHPVWLELKKRIGLMQADAERTIENPDSFLHGQGVGQRKVLKVITGLPEQFLTELKVK